MSTATNKKDEPKKIDIDAIAQAVKDCLVEKMSVREAARVYNVPRTNLQRYLKKVGDKFNDIFAVQDDELMEYLRTCNQRTPSNMTFSQDQEKNLVQYILKCVDHLYGLSITELRKLAYNLAKKIDVCPEIWNDEKMAPRHWYYRFMKRHPQLVLRTPEETSINRAKAFCKPNVDWFFENYQTVLSSHDFGAAQIFNMDESGFFTEPTKIGKVIALKGMNRVGQMVAAERGTMVTMALTVSAAGNSIPPFFLFPWKKMQSRFLDHVSCGTAGYANESGWMCQPEFVYYMRHFIAFAKPSLASPVILLMDNHCSHLSVEAIDLAVENSVHIVTFPPHCSYRLQPLDVSVFGPVKSYYKSQCSAWQKNNANKVLELRHIAGLACKALDLALTPKVIKSGFRKTGIYPYDPDIFCDADFVQAVEQNETLVATEGPIDEDDQRRIVFAPFAEGEEVALTTTRSSRSRSVSATYLLDEIGPLQGASPKKVSNRGRTPMKTSILTSPEVVAALHDKAAKKLATSTPVKKAKRKPIPPAERSDKRKKQEASDEEENKDFCLICLDLLPPKLTKFNSIKCNGGCDRFVHLKCAAITNSYFTCKNCESDEEEL